MEKQHSAREATDPDVEVEETPEEVEETPEKEPASTDPLDAIEDEEARSLAKAERSKARREARRKSEAEPEPKPEPEPQVEASSYATKDDLKKIATNEAKKMVAPEVMEAWEDLVGIPLGGFDPMDSDSIAKNMQQRYFLYQQSQTAAADDPTKEFTASPDMPTSGGNKATKKTDTESPSLPGYREAVSPDKWY